jgi:hypothetical protein
LIQGLKGGSLNAAETAVPTEGKNTPLPVESTLTLDTTGMGRSLVLAGDTTHKLGIPVAAYKPDPKKAVWYSALCPGLGQIYNRRYWKLPFIGAGMIGVAYAIGWNSKYYNAYTHAYRDISDTDPNTNSYLDLLPPGATGYTLSYLETVIKNRQKQFRRNRDLSYMSAAGVYLVCLLDAFIDAQLYDFDISPDLSLTPARGKSGFAGFERVELGLAFRF